MSLNKQNGEAGAEPVGPGAESTTITCPEGQMPNPEGTGCIDIPVPAAESAGATPMPVEASLVKRVERTVMAYMAEMEKRLNKIIETKMNDIVKAKENDIEMALRKSFGLEVDPPLHRSDLEKFARKLQLTTAQKPTRTPLLKDATGPEGTGVANQSSDSRGVDALMKQYGFKKA